MTRRLELPSLTFICSLLSVLILFVSGCGPQGTPTPANSAVHAGGIWVDDIVNEPDSLIPNASVQTFASMVDQTLYAPLFYGDSQGQIHAGVAAEIPTTENHEISADLKTWVFKLRPNVTWSDGTPLNADDVDFTWRLWTNPAFAAADTVAFRLITSATVSSDKLSITFHLSQPYAPFIATWTDGRHAPMPKHHFATMSPAAIKKNEGLNPQVVSGPFKMSESKPGDHYTVVKNPNYYRKSEGLPHLDKIVFRVVADQDTLLKDLQEGTIDSAYFLDVSKMAEYRALTRYQIVTNPSASYEALHFDSNNPIFNDVTVRKAIAMAIDRNQLIQIARLGQAQPLCTDHGPAYNPGYQQNVQCPAFDTAAANTLLNNDGWVLGADNVRHKGSQRLEFQYSTTQGNHWRENDEQLIQADLAKIGVKADITNYPGGTFFGTSFLLAGQPGKYDLAEWASSYVYDPDDASNFACSQIPPRGGNLNFYCNQQLDSLFAKEVATADRNARQQIFDQIHQIFLTSFPVVVLYNLLDVEIAKKGTHNYQPGPFGATETVNVWDWWCDNGKCPSGGA
jgi:peptide/nickel transport system substrate-binding protein